MNVYLITKKQKTKKKPLNKNSCNVELPVEIMKNRVIQRRKKTHSKTSMIIDLHNDYLQFEALISAYQLCGFSANIYM